ncbi:uncharacterized protein LOC117906454 [Vitis riparia]|uniref:uncharacterized protein LOC117906454 n=1 Tax=Vitis riparia TaxID=96939 RepID=UPI00155B2433|nr:uncharacterized protein LOC117906454 [Vitis riparia]
MASLTMSMVVLVSAADFPSVGKRGPPTYLLCAASSSGCFSIACISISAAFWNFALILVSLQHFKPRSRFLLFIPSTSIACISISAALSFFLAFVSLENLNKARLRSFCNEIHGIMVNGGVLQINRCGKVETLQVEDYGEYVVLNTKCTPRPCSERLKGIVICDKTV